MKSHFKENCAQDIMIKNISLRKLNTFLVGGTGFEYGFEYYSGGEWKTYIDRDGNSNVVTLRIDDSFFCSNKRNYLVYNDVSRKMVQDDLSKDYSMEVWIWSDFEKSLLIYYGLIILVIDILITLIWLLRIIFREIKHRSL